MTVSKARRDMGWGVLDQALSSGTNLALTLLAGRLLGPNGLGVVVIAFSVYILALTLQRALVNHPLVVASTRLAVQERHRAVRSAVTLVLCSGVIFSGVILAIAVLLPPAGASGLRLIAPWIVPALLQDLWRSVLFRDRRGAAAALNDGLWAVGIVAALPVAIVTRQEWAVMGAWGFGAALGAIAGFVQTRDGPQHPGPAWQWWRSMVWPFGRWFGLESVVLSLHSQAVVFLLGWLLGTGGLGGLRAAEAVFAPMTLLGSALDLPGLPAVSRALAESEAAARRRAVQLSSMALTAVAAYLLVVGLLRQEVLTIVFGAAFASFSDLVVPISVGQLLYAGAIGFNLLLKAQRRGRALVGSRMLSSVSSLLLLLYLGSRYGVIGASWGLALGNGLRWVSVTVLAVHHRGGSSEGVTPADHAAAGGGVGWRRRAR
jgi:O-antigen/teichoic acid export membrane protein